MSDKLPVEVSLKLHDQQKKITELETELEDFKNCHKGACQTCEPVGMLNKELTAQLEREHKHLSEHAELCKELTESVKDMREVLEIIGVSTNDNFWCNGELFREGHKFHGMSEAKIARECLEKWKELEVEGE